jgi:inner membrane protein
LDSVTQIVLGAAVATVCVPKEHRRKAILIGAILGTMPDLDVLIDYGDAVSNFTYHRGFSHSLFVLIPFALSIWLMLKNVYQPVREAPGAWLLAISLALITHPLLDAHTAYGTQLFWPLSSPPVMWSTIFIIDPLYTLPLLIGVILILIKPQNIRSKQFLVASILLSSSYLAWTWTAKYHVENQVFASLKNKQELTSIFTTPTPFNTLLWRVVVMKEDTYLEGYYSLLNAKQGINFQTYTKNLALIEQGDAIASVKRLQWFSQGFIKSSIVDDGLVISDLRMGVEGNYVFSHIVAKASNPGWRVVESERLPIKMKVEDLYLIWEKLKGEP